MGHHVRVLCMIMFMFMFGVCVVVFVEHPRQKFHATQPPLHLSFDTVRC